LGESDLLRVFVGVARVLRERGLFQFDLNTGHMLRWLAGREKLFRVGPHLFIASNAFDTATGIATFHQTWFVRQARLYRKLDVVVRERAFDERTLRRTLRRAGLRLVHAETQRAVQGRPTRKVYLAATPAALRQRRLQRGGRPAPD
jgi:hypothetical protein